MIRLQRTQNWDQPLQCPQVFDGKKKDVEAHGEARARKQTETGKPRQEPVCLGVLGLIKQDLMSERLYISQPNVSEGLFLLPQMRSDHATQPLWSLGRSSSSQASLRERQTERNEWKHHKPPPRSILHVIILPTFYLISVAKCHRGDKWNRIYGT